MFVQLEALMKVDDNVDYSSLGIPIPEDILSFAPVWVNLACVVQFYPSTSHEKETILVLSNGKSMQINMPEENFLILLDRAGLLPGTDTQTITFKTAS